jgi:hypothetical protein
MLIHGVELVVHPDFRALFEGLTSPDDVISKWGGALPSGMRRSAVADLRLPAGHFFLKVYAYSGLWRLRTIFIVSRAGREYRNLLRLAGLGFNVPRPVAFGQARTLGLVSQSFVMTRAIEDAASIWSFLHEPRTVPIPFPDRSERLRLIAEFARVLRRAHEGRFFIHTLRSKNVLLTRSGAGYEINLIDVPFAGIWRWRIFSRAGRVRDLATLLKWARQLLSRTERMRFAKAYGADRSLIRSAQAYQERHYPTTNAPDPP